MMKITSSLTVLLVILFFQLLAIDSYACMCGATSVCEAYSNADAIVMAKVKSYKPVDVPGDVISPNSKSNDFYDGQEVMLQISKVYKGKFSKQLKLTQPLSTCDWEFSEKNVEKEYLFYLYHNIKYDQFRIITCGRSAELNKAANDLSWLNGLPASLKRTRIAGISQYRDDDRLFPPAPNIKMQIKGDKVKHFVTTDKNGLYEMWDVPIGKYSIFPEAPIGYELAWTTSTPDNWIYFWNPDKDLRALEVTINKESCGGVDFMFKAQKDEE